MTAVAAQQTAPFREVDKKHIVVVQGGPDLRR